MTDAAGGWTKGPCKASRARKSSNFGNWTAFVQCETGTIAKVMGGPVDDRTVAETNAALIAEAFNVATETGLSPRQLAEQRAELLTTLRPFAEAFEAISAEDVALPGVMEMSIERILFMPDQPTINDLRAAWELIECIDAEAIAEATTRPAAKGEG